MTRKGLAVLAVAGLLLAISTVAGVASAPQPLTTPRAPDQEHYVYLPLIVRNHPPPPLSVPLYRLYANYGDLAKLAESPYLDETIPAVFIDERSWEVYVRYRGDTSRLMPKKCWKVFFPGSDFFQGQEELNLNADYPDQTLLRSYVNYDLFARVGIPTPRAAFARLHINDGYYGLFSQVEQVDKLFLHVRGIEMHGNLYKPFYGNLTPEVDDWWYSYHYPKKTNRESKHEDLVSFITLINETPDGRFPETIAKALDVNGWLDWYAVNILIGNFEMLEKNYYLYHDFSANRWIILPWDVDIALGHNADAGAGGYGHLLDEEISWDNPIDSGTRESKKVDGKYNALIDRMMKVPEFRFFHCRRLEELMADEFSPAEMFPRIDDAFLSIRPWAEADPHRWQPEGFQFSNGPDELKMYITHRIQFLEEGMPDFCPDLEVPLAINELMTVNASTIADEAGDYDSWFEVYNKSSTLTWDLGGMYLTDNLSETTKWRIPDDTLVLPGEALLFWADGEEGEGSLHTSFELSGTVGQIGLFDRDVFSNTPISVLTFTAQITDVSCGRMPDGSSSSWLSFTASTPGWPNRGLPPRISEVTHTMPAGGEPVTITAIITDEGIVTATLWYRAFAPGTSPPAYQSRSMTPAGGGLYTCTLPAQAGGTWVEYYLEAVDEAGMTRVDRPGWPQGDYRYIVGWQRPSIYINELMALNTHTLEDEYGDHDDWVEIYNAGSAPVNLSGMYLSDNITEHTYWQIPDGAILLGGSYLLIWLDGEHWVEKPFHGSFRLAGDGEQITLYDSQAHYYAPIDAVYFPPQTPNVSWGRFSDGGDEWYAMTTPTPGKPNLLRPPQFVGITRSPTWPGAGEGVTVTAIITAGSSAISATLWYDVGSGFQPAPMAGAVTYTAHISPQSEGTRVKYYLEAVDDGGQCVLYPAAAPEATFRYLIGYTPPAVLINEFLADNERVNQDEAGEYDDWLELYNSGAVTATLDGIYLTDELTEPQKWQFPIGTTIPPGGHLLVWCDRNEMQGPLHADFKLSADGEEVGLFSSEAHGLVPLDWIVFGPQREDVSYGRRPDGSNRWNFLDSPSPGASNE